MKKAKNLTTIGSKTVVDFPDQGFFAIPAKVDTGADSSSLWASSIREEKGILSFVLFDVSSPFYTGKQVTVDKFSVSNVKNSFGVSEYRYKVSLKVVVEKRVINARFTLSNRKDNKFPILIGRQTLKNRFLVDVSKLGKTNYKVLMISTKKTPVTAKFADNLTKQAKKIDIHYISYDDLVFVTGGGKNDIRLLGSNKKITDFDLVYLKTTTAQQEIAASVARYLLARRVQFMDLATANYPMGSKLYQYIILADNHIKVPKSVFVMPSKLVESYELFKVKLGLPFILKDINGNKGENNYLVHDEKEFKKVVSAVKSTDVKLIGQKFVANDSDYRVLVFGGRISMVIKRKRTSKKTHLNNTSLGAKAKVVPTIEIPVEIRKICIKAGKLIDRQIVGVDLVKEKKTGLWYCLEVNDGPQLASGSFVSEKNQAFADYLLRKLED